MAKNKISDYSATANSNTDIGGINVDEGCAPSGINDAIRTLMAQLKNFQTGTGGDSFNGPVGTTTPAAGAFTTLSASGVATFSAGSAAAPALTTSGDTDTGVLFPAANTVAIATAGSERARIDSSGNLGLGVSPSAWGSGWSAFQVGGNGSLFAEKTAGASKLVALTQNAYHNGTNNIYISSDLASRYRQGSGAHIWETAASGTAGNAISFTQAMTLTAAGNLGVGTTTPDILSYRVINAVGSGTSQGGLLNLDVSDGSATFRLYSNSSGATISMDDNLPMAFNTNGTERARIDSSGNLLVGTTSTTDAHVLQTPNNSVWVTRFINSNASNPYGIQVVFTQKSPNGVGNQFLTCADTTNNRLIIQSNGGIANYQANNSNLSDRREKTNFAPAGEYLAKICAIPVQTFNYIDQNLEEDVGLTLGVVAQDVQAVAPELVTESNWGTKEAPKMRLSIYQTDLQYALMKCIQEQQAIIQTLTSRIEALEQA